MNPIYFPEKHQPLIVLRWSTDPWWQKIAHEIVSMIIFIQVLLHESHRNQV